MKSIKFKNNLTIEQMREIVDGAPDGATHIIESFKSLDYLKFDGSWWILYEYTNAPSEWVLTCFRTILAEFKESIQRLDDLRTAIAKHDSPEFKVGDLVVRRGSIHYISNSYALWRVIHVLQTAIPCIEVAPVTRKGRVMLARAGVYVEHQFDHATLSEIKAGHRIDDTTDHVTDIRNYVSPSTIVTDLHVNETDKLNRLG